MKYLIGILLLPIYLLSTVAYAQSCGNIKYENKNGYVIMETENSPSPRGKWVKKSNVAGFKGSGHSFRLRDRSPVRCKCNT